MPGRQRRLWELIREVYGETHDDSKIGRKRLERNMIRVTASDAVPMSFKDMND